MRKLLFILGLLILLIGVGAFKPSESEDALEQTGIRDSIWEYVQEPLAGVYEENLEEQLDLEMAGYVLMGLGAILILVSFKHKKKKSDAGAMSTAGRLLYQALGRISPEELGQKAERDKMREGPKAALKEKSMELPAVMDEPTVGPGIAPPAPGMQPMQPMQPSGPQQAFSPLINLFKTPVNPLMGLFHRSDGQASGATGSGRGSPGGPVRRFKCASCSEVFTVKHKDNTVTCPSCNTSFKL